MLRVHSTTGTLGDRPFVCAPLSAQTVASVSIATHKISVVVVKLRSGIGEKSGEWGAATHCTAFEIQRLRTLFYFYSNNSLILYSLPVGVGGWRLEMMDFSVIKNVTNSLRVEVEVLKLKLKGRVHEVT